MKQLIKHLIILIVLMNSALGCSSSPKTKQIPEILPSKTIYVQSSDISEEEIKGMLKLVSYIHLSNQVPLGEVKRIIIDHDKIYVLDNEPKIVCFDIHGKILFKINNRGPGPMEYDEIADFGINSTSGQLIAFDNYKMRIFLYDSKNGKFQSEFSVLNLIAPTELGIIGDVFFFKNIDHHRFDVQQQQMFYLLYSQDGKHINQMFLPHDAVAEYGFDLRSFFYNERRLFFIKPFDNIVYQLFPGEIHPLYEIHLPNPLPMKKIEEKMEHWDLSRSAYAYNLSNIYQVGNVLYFTFSKDGWITQAFFDTSTDQLLHCSRGLLSESRKNLPFIGIVDGVYEDKFFSLISPESIIFRRKQHPELFSKDLLNMGDEDNGVIAFYSFDPEDSK